jgi:hypothetical protein
VKSVTRPRFLITRKRSAQAAGSGVKERSSRTQVLILAPLLDGAQRLEGRAFESKHRSRPLYRASLGGCQPLQRPRLRLGHCIVCHLDFQAVIHRFRGLRPFFTFTFSLLGELGP